MDSGSEPSSSLTLPALSAVFLCLVKIDFIRQSDHRPGFIVIIIINSRSEAAANTEIKVPSSEIPKLGTVLLLKPGVGHYIATHASPTALT